ncbi:hypothetical protein L8106_02122 [Lyngbya sp. PCC 8106]|nr:hypothetical protein L8106_02122 [Lyngbya sp. PCC 8106]
MNKNNSMFFCFFFEKYRLLKLLDQGSFGKTDLAVDEH